MQRERKDQKDLAVIKETSLKIHFNQLVPDNSLGMKIKIKPSHVIGLEDQLTITSRVLGPPFAGGRIMVHLLGERKRDCEDYDGS